jgi:hypothetical protein
MLPESGVLKEFSGLQCPKILVLLSITLLGKFLKLLDIIESSAPTQCLGSRAAHSTPNSSTYSASSWRIDI